MSRPGPLAIQCERRPHISACWAAHRRASAGSTASLLRRGLRKRPHGVLHSVSRRWPAADLDKEGGRKRKKKRSSWPSNAVMLLTRGDSTPIRQKWCSLKTYIILMGPKWGTTILFEQPRRRRTLCFAVDNCTRAKREKGRGFAGHLCLEWREIGTPKDNADLWKRDLYF